MFSLPGYLITEAIYENDCLRVYRGERVQNRSPVMIKVPVAESHASIARLLHEFEIIRHLDIKGVIKPVALELAGLIPVLVMEDHGFVPLKVYLGGSRPDLPVYFSIAVQLTEVLGELYEKNVILHEIKFDDIFIHPGTDAVHIAGFSAATVVSRTGQSDSTADIPAGNPAYMPEQIGRTGGAVDRRSVLYSLGVILYEMLSGRLPWQVENGRQWIHAHMARRPVYLGEIRPDIPPVVCAIIMKLLAKSMTERYQSTAGLQADLEECRRRWRNTGRLESFLLGREDVHGCFQLPRRLYGREREAAAVAAAVERLYGGQARLMLVHGDAGAGKTMLINETIKSLTVKRGYFASGKVDQLQRNTPYAPFVQALGNLLRQFLAESRENLTVWKRKLVCALGGAGAVMIEVLPETALIIGPQPPVESLPPREAQNRFRLVFRKFIQVLAQQEHPLILFLDDLQWADPASLQLLQYLSETADSRYLLLIGAYRANEVSGTHPLYITLAELEKAGIPVEQLSLLPLGPEHTRQFIADALHCQQAQVEPLAEILYRKTGGNPFFLGQLLQTAYHKNLVYYNARAGCWAWDAASIRGMPIAGDIIKLMLGKLQQLPAVTRDAVQIAACIGNSFDLHTLAMAREQTPAQTAADLRPSVAAGVVLPVFNPGNIADRFEFLHDRVQQAAYALSSAAERKRTHLKIGRLLLDKTDQEEPGAIFDIMEHLNRGLDLISEPDERRKLAKCNLSAGRKAKSATAFDAALNYFKAGLALLPGQAWHDHYQLMFELHLERFQCEHLCARFDIAEQCFALLLSKAKTKLEKADLYGIKMTLSAGLEKYDETLQLGIKGLSLLGVRLPLKPGKFTLYKELFLTKWRLRNFKPADFAGLPPMTDPVQKTIMRFLSVQGCVAYLLNSSLHELSFLKILNLSVKYGHSDYSPLGYYGFVVNSWPGDCKREQEYVQLALKLVEKHDNSRFKCVFNFMVGAYVSHWQEHGESCINSLQTAANFGLAAGDWLFAGYAYTVLLETRYLLGVPLSELAPVCQSYYKFAKRTRLLNYRLLIATLQREDDTGTFSDDECDEDTFKALIKGDSQAVMTYYVSKIQIFYLHGDYRSALMLAEQASQEADVIKGLLLSAEYNFYYSLAISAAYEELPRNQQRKYWKIITANQRQMQKWSKACSANFLHKYLLVAAEMARLRARVSEAMALYDQSIQAAHEHGYGQKEALASELAARFYLAQGRGKIAQVYLRDACRAYARWGGAGKVRQLQKNYPHLLSANCGERETEQLSKILIHALRLAHGGLTGHNTEMCAIRKAYKELAEETDPSVLLNSLLEIAIEHGGGDQGYVILEKNDKLLIAAAQDGVVHAGAAVPTRLEKSANLSRAIVRYVARTLESVVLNDAEQAGIFTQDSYFAKPRVQAIVCLPLLCQNISVGVLYLANTFMTGVFTPDRLEVLKLLAGQIACIQTLGTFFGEEAPDDAPDQTTRSLIEPLTGRELDVLGLLVDGMSNKEIAWKLQLTINTVKTHIVNIYGKLHVTRRVQAIIRARELKLLKR